MSAGQMIGRGPLSIPFAPTWLNNRSPKTILEGLIKLTGLTKATAGTAHHFGLSSAAKVVSASGVAGDVLLTSNLISNAAFTKKNPKATWQQSISSTLGTTRQSIKSIEFLGGLFNLSIKIGRIPVMGFALSVMMPISSCFSFWHHMRVYRRDDPESLEIIEKISSLREIQRLRRILNDSTAAGVTERRIGILKQILADRRTQSMLSIINSVNWIALGILSAALFSAGGAAAVTASAPLLVLGLFAQTYATCLFFYDLGKKKLKEESDPLLVEQFKNIRKKEH